MADDPTRRGGDSPAFVPGLGRREVIQGLLGGVGAGLALPLTGGADPLEHHAADPARMARAAADAAAPKATPEFLDPHAYETLASLAERIVPGATKVSGAYYSSEAGMRELGWTGQQFFASFPGCPHPGGHR